MSSRTQLAPLAIFEPRVFEPVSVREAHSKGTAAVSRRNVLLVGRSRSWGTLLLKYLEKFGSDFSFASPQTVTPEYARNSDYNLILLDSTVPAEQRRQLAAELVGSEASIYYTFPVENGCWWLPAMRRGRHCLGAPAFRRNEFPLELERALRDQIEA
jgi:hypothetical protein